jgi:hypothetical protein
MYWDSFRFVARDLGVGYMMALRVEHLLSLFCTQGRQKIIGGAHNLCGGSFSLSPGKGKQRKKTGRSDDKEFSHWGAVCFIS